LFGNKIYIGDNMNDYWNDPPEQPEPPECCEDFMDMQANGDFICPTCGRVIQCEPDPGYAEMIDEELPEMEPLDLPDPDYHLSDLAFDAARERGMR
jgi:hypothetical protein